MKSLRAPLSVRSYVLIWLIVPLAAILAVNTYFLYRSALHSVNIAYDRTLLATAHAVGDSVRYENGDYRLSLPLALFEIYEADQSGRYYFRVSTSDGKVISGDEEITPFQGKPPKNATYPAVVHFYQDTYRDEPIRVAVLFQPVFSNDAAGTVVIQVAEPMKIREESANEILTETVLRQGGLMLVLCLAVYVSVFRALKPLNQLSKELDQRSADDLSALSLNTDLQELKTVANALNRMMERLARLIDHQKRFIANASHQLRTPLAVLKTQLQSGRRGDVPPETIMEEMSVTVERTITLANQMLLLAKIEQRQSQGRKERCHLGNLAREAAVALSPLIAGKNLDFEIDSVESWIEGDAWLINELIQNLLSNAIHHTPTGGQLGIEITASDKTTRLLVWDSGNGLSEEQQDHPEQMFEPFSTSFSTHGNGLGLAIANGIASSHGGRILLANRIEDGKIVGLNAEVIFPSV